MNLRSKFENTINNLYNSNLAKNARNIAKDLKFRFEVLKEFGPDYVPKFVTSEKNIDWKTIGITAGAVALPAVFGYAANLQAASDLNNIMSDLNRPAQEASMNKTDLSNTYIPSSNDIQVMAPDSLSVHCGGKSVLGPLEFKDGELIKTCVGNYVFLLDNMFKEKYSDSKYDTRFTAGGDAVKIVNGEVVAVQEGSARVYQLVFYKGTDIGRDGAHVKVDVKNCDQAQDQGDNDKPDNKPSDNDKPSQKHKPKEPVTPHDSKYDISLGVLAGNNGQREGYLSFLYAPAGYTNKGHAFGLKVAGRVPMSVFSEEGIELREISGDIDRSENGKSHFYRYNGFVQEYPSLDLEIAGIFRAKKAPTLYFELAAGLNFNIVELTEMIFDNYTELSDGTLNTTFGLPNDYTLLAVSPTIKFKTGLEFGKRKENKAGGGHRGGIFVSFGYDLPNINGTIPNTDVKVYDMGIHKGFNFTVGGNINF